MSPRITELAVIEIIRASADVKTEMRGLRMTVSEVRDGDSTQVSAPAKCRQGPAGDQPKAKRAPRKRASSKANTSKPNTSKRAAPKSGGRPPYTNAGRGAGESEVKDSAEEKQLQEIFISELTVANAAEEIQVVQLWSRFEEPAR